jgi:hypothetical protein
MTFGVFKTRCRRVGTCRRVKEGGGQNVSSLVGRGAGRSRVRASPESALLFKLSRVLTSEVLEIISTQHISYV